MENEEFVRRAWCQWIEDHVGARRSTLQWARIDQKYVLSGAEWCRRAVFVGFRHWWQVPVSCSGLKGYYHCAVRDFLTMTEGNLWCTLVSPMPVASVSGPRLQEHSRAISWRGSLPRDYVVLHVAELLHCELALAICGTSNGV